MKGIKILIDEHDNIQEFNKVVKEIGLRLLKDESIEIEDLKNSIEFIKIYADKIHHGKEEDILFKDMENELGQIGKNLVTHGMLVEHDIARYYVSELVKAVDSYEMEESAETRLNLITYLMAYRDLLERHIYKENKVVYPYAENNLKEDILKSVDDKTVEFEEKYIEDKERFLKILEEMKEKYNIK